MPFPPMTPEKRAEALAKAAKARTERSEIKGRLKAGRVSLAEVLADSKNDIVGKMKVTDLLAAMPGLGKVRVQQLMERLDIDQKRRVRGLGDRQRKALLAEFASADA